MSWVTDIFHLVHKYDYWLALYHGLVTRSPVKSTQVLIDMRDNDARTVRFWKETCCCYNPTTTKKIWLRIVYADGDVAATLLRPWRWSYVFVALLYPFYIESEIPIRFYYDQGASIALLPFLLRFLSFWPKFRIVAESPSSGKGVKLPLVYTLSCTVGSESRVASSTPARSNTFLEINHEINSAL